MTDRKHKNGSDGHPVLRETRARRARRWQWPSDQEINTFGILFALIYGMLGTLGQCTMDPATGGQDPIYDRDQYD